MNRLIGGTLLVSGTTIGGGMLVLPVLTAGAGLVPSIVLILAIWLFMFISAFWILEVALTMETGANMITMAAKTLGNIGKGISWVAYLLLLYCLTAAYLAGSGELISHIFKQATGLIFPEWMEPLPTLLIFGFFIYMGTRLTDYCNRIFMLGLAVTFIVVMGSSIPEMSQTLTEPMHWDYLAVSAPVVITAFGFHIVIPSLVRYLDRDTKKLKACLVIGSLIPLAAYLIWQTVTFGVIPLHGEVSLAEAFRQGCSVTLPLAETVSQGYFKLAARLLHTFAIITSFLGVTLSLSDFLTDGLKLDRSHSSRILVTALTFLPPLFFVWSFPRVFAVALEYGGIFVAILLGLLPMAMAWSRRYRQQVHSCIKVAGGRPLFILAGVIFLLIIVAQIADAFGFFVYLNQKYLGV